MFRSIPTANGILTVLVCLSLPGGPVSAGMPAMEQVTAAAADNGYALAAFSRSETARPPADDNDIVSRSDRLAIRRIVRAQILAIVTRNAERAFSFITPDAQQKFQTPTAYLNRLIRIFYPILYTERFQFTGLFTSQPVIQSVLLKGANQRQWLAYFYMRRLADGEWRIKDCIIESKVEAER